MKSDPLPRLRSKPTRTYLTAWQIGAVQRFAYLSGHEENADAHGHCDSQVKVVVDLDHWVLRGNGTSY